MSNHKPMTEVQAYNILDAVDEGFVGDNTVIDDMWWDSFYDNWMLLEALLVITKLRYYKEIVEKYEGWTVSELLDAYMKQEL